MANCIRPLEVMKNGEMLPLTINGNPVICGQPVSGGGNMHPIGHCRTWSKSNKRRRKKKPAEYQDDDMKKRGTAVNLNKGKKEAGKKG